jgi:hypothetical protein
MPPQTPTLTFVGRDDKSVVACLIPAPEIIEAELDRIETEADLLRRLMRLALRRRDEAERLAAAKEERHVR